MRTLPPSNGQRQQAPSQPQQPTNVAPLRQPQQAPAQRSATPSAKPIGGGGLPPPPADFDPDAGGGGGGKFEKRDDAYWAAHPLVARDEPYLFTAYVNKIKWWGLDGYSIDFRVVDWDHAANRPLEHHGRTIPWAQAMTASKMWEYQSDDFDVETQKKAGRAYGHFRRKLVAAYAACGWPEDRWPKDGDHPAPPWHLFFVHPLANGLAVPICLDLEVVVERGREKWPEVRRVGIVTDSQRKVPFEAPMPYEVPPAGAAHHRWVVNEERRYTVPAKDAKNGFHYDAYEVTTAVLNRVDVGGVGLPTYKDL